MRGTKWECNCLVIGCESRAQSRQMCRKHYMRWRRSGTTDDRQLAAERTEKQCSGCKQVLPVESFFRNRALVDRLTNYCKPCFTANNRRYKYKLNEPLAEWLKGQGSKCAICGTPLTVETANVDHDHACCPKGSSCGKCVRGALCRECNLGLASFGDDPKRLAAAVRYLDRTKDILGM